MKVPILMFLIMTGTMVGVVEIPTVFAHYPDFEVKTTKDILKFCEFFYDEYVLLGVDNLVELHQEYPNLRACVILYNHIAWKSTHQARDIVLIAEIEKYLGDVRNIKERHMTNFDEIPEWLKNDAKMWVRGETKDTLFALGIRTLLKEHVLNPSLSNADKNCNENKLCITESDFMKYSYSNKYVQDITETYTVNSIEDNEILLTTEKISKEGKEVIDISTDNQGTILANEKCCVVDKFIFLTSINLGDSITADLKISGDTPYEFNNKTRQAWIAQNAEKQDMVIIDKDTGLLVLHNHKEVDIVPKWERVELVDTNIFEKNYLANELVIPKWVKTITMWLLDGLISESEYLNAIENLLERKIIRV